MIRQKVSVVKNIKPKIMKKILNYPVSISTMLVLLSLSLHEAFTEPVEQVELLEPLEHTESISVDEKLTNSGSIDKAYYDGRTFYVLYDANGSPVQFILLK